PGVAAATGALVGLAYPPAKFLADLLLPDRLYEPGWLCGLVFGLLVATVLAGAAWRAALWAAAGQDRSVRTMPAAAAFTGALLLALIASTQLPSLNSWTTL